MFDAFEDYGEPTDLPSGKLIGRLVAVDRA
ncbi:MAG: hypothetical protein JWM99_1769 [Verrucomicrobiales bacterium]|nr:hypothetical protein [Verrucomicrobiales bacterium]